MTAFCYRFANWMLFTFLQILFVCRNSQIVSFGMQFPFSKFTRVVVGIVGMFSLYFLVDYYHLLPFSGSGANQNRLLYEEYPEMPKVGIPLLCNHRRHLVSMTFPSSPSQGTVSFLRFTLVLSVCFSFPI